MWITIEFVYKRYTIYIQWVPDCHHSLEIKGRLPSAQNTHHHENAVQAVSIDDHDLLARLRERAAHEG